MRRGGTAGRAHPRRELRLAWRGRGALLALGVALGVPACASDPEPRPITPAFDLHHPDPRRRARAAHEAAAARDMRYVPDLIELLDDGDESVRLVASHALRETTGHETGYVPYAPRAERRARMAAWRAWLASRPAPAPVREGAP